MSTTDAILLTLTSPLWLSMLGAGGLCLIVVVVLIGLAAAAYEALGKDDL